jgi:hypothetical protein
MRSATVDNGPSPLGKIEDGPFGDDEYPAVTDAASRLIETAATWARELAAFPGDGDIIISKRGNTMSVVAPDRAKSPKSKPACSCGGTCADGVADFGATLLAIGGDCPICKTSLMSNPFSGVGAPPIGTGLQQVELWGQKLFTSHMAWLDSLLEMRAIRERLAELEQMAIDVCADGVAKVAVNEPDYAPVQEVTITVACDTTEVVAAIKAARDAAMDELQHLGQEFDAAPVRSILDVADDLDALPEFIPHEAELVEQINARFGPHDSVGSGSAHDGPKHVELSTHVAASETGSPASSAAPERDLDSAYGADLDRIASEQFGVTRSPGETDTSLRAFLRARDRADDMAAGIWPGIGGSQAVDAGRYNAVDVGAPILD